MYNELGAPITMNTLDRSLIEKAGYDNGFEIVLKDDLSVVSLGSSLPTNRLSILSVL